MDSSVKSFSKYSSTQVSSWKLVLVLVKHLGFCREFMTGFFSGYLLSVCLRTTANTLLILENIYICVIFCAIAVLRFSSYYVFFLSNFPQILEIMRLALFIFMNCDSMKFIFIRCKIFILAHVTIRMSWNVLNVTCVM